LTRDAEVFMPSGHFLGKIAFLIALIGLGLALAGWPKSRLGRGDGILMNAAIVVMALHWVVPLPDFASGLTALVGIALIGTALVRRSKSG
jgi:Flp pilus assembly protein protease CpaA